MNGERDRAMQRAKTLRRWVWRALDAMDAGVPGAERDMRRLVCEAERACAALTPQQQNEYVMWIRSQPWYDAWAADFHAKNGGRRAR